MTDKPTPTTDLLKRGVEIHEGRSTGVLSGEALRDYAKRKWPGRRDTLQMAEHETGTEALALLAKWGQPAQAAEPVAWAFKYDDGTWHDPSTTEHSSGMRPLFAAPQPVAQAGAVTDAQVLAAVRVLSPSLFRHGLQPLPHDGANTAAQMRKEADTVRKMLEAANGIKGGRHG